MKSKQKYMLIARSRLQQGVEMMMIIFKVVFQTKQILSIFLEYLVEQSLLLQHEYKWSTISPRNQQTKIGFCIIL